MTNPLIKICGISQIDNLLEIMKFKEINYLGFIFYEKSPRYISKEFLNSIKNIDFANKRPVCVYVNATSDFINKTSSYFKNPIIQFHGDETNQFCVSFNKDFWKVVRMKDSNSIDDVNNYPDASAILLETYKKGIHGGTGESFNWKLLENTNLQHKTFEGC